MPNDTPAVVEKQLVDINLANGINESVPVDSVDWTTHLTACNNLIIDGSGLSPRPGTRRLGSFVGQVDKVAAAKDGCLAFASNGVNEVLYQLEEGNATPTFLEKSRVPGYSVTSKTVSSSAGGIAATVGVYGVINFTKYQVICHSMPNLIAGSGPFRMVIVDRTSGNIVRNYVYKDGALGTTSWQGLIPTIVGVGDRYIHLYLTAENLTGAGGFKPKMTVIDTLALPGYQYAAIGLDSLSYTDLAGTAVGDRLAGVVPLATSSTAVVRGATCRIQNFNNSGTSVTNGTVASISCTGFYSDGTTYYLSGINGADYVYKEVSGAYSTTRTVTGPAFPAGGIGEIRVAADGTGNARLIAYVSETDQNSGTFPCPVVYAVAIGGTSFTTLGYLPYWCEASLPTFVDGEYLVHMHNMMYGDTNDPISNCDAVIDLTLSKTQGTGFGYGGTSGPQVFWPEAVLDTYTASDGRPDASITFLAYGAVFANKGPAYRPHKTLSGSSSVDIGFAHWSRSQSTLDSAMSFTVDVLKRVAAATYKTHVAVDSISGGVLSSYDGNIVGEYGFVHAPNLTVKDAGAGSMGAGIYNYVVVFSYRDSLGRIHYSRTSRPRAITQIASKNVTIQIVVPTVSMRYSDMQVQVYRTAAGGTQYYFLAQNRIYTAAGTSTVPDNEVYMTLTDSTLDATLIAQPLLYRQPGTTGTALDRYHAVSANHVCRHKDRVFYCNGNTVYYSSFAVDNEAPWFHPAFSFQVPGGSGDIVALASMDGILVVLKRDYVAVVDGDGPAENGGNGTEFSPPRQIHTEFGCVDARTLVNVPIGIMYRSPRGIELLKRNLQTDFVGRNVERTVNTYAFAPETGRGHGACFDRVNSRVLFLMSSQSASRVAVFDLLSGTGGAWTTFSYASIDSGLVGTIGYARSVDYAGTKGDYVYYGGVGVFADDKDGGLDSGANFVPFFFSTGWLKGSSMQDRLKVTDLMVMGHRQSNHNLYCTYGVDYDTATAQTTIKTFTGADTTLVPEVLVFQPAKENVRSISFTVVSATPTVNTTLGTGKQVDITGLTVRLGLKGGGAKLPSAQKG